MKVMFNTVSLVLALLVFAACSSGSGGEDASGPAEVPAGSEEIVGGLLGLVRTGGVTLSTVDGVSRTYIGDSGRLATQIIAEGSIVERSWRVDNGVWCETSPESAQEACLDRDRVFLTLDESYLYFADGVLQPERTFTLEQGNPYGL